MNTCSPKKNKRILFNSSPLSTKNSDYASKRSISWLSTKSYTPSQTEIDRLDRIHSLLDTLNIDIIEPGGHINKKVSTCPTIEEEKGSLVLLSLKKIEVINLDFTKSTLFKRRKTADPPNSP